MADSKHPYMYYVAKYDDIEKAQAEYKKDIANTSVAKKRKAIKSLASAARKAVPVLGVGAAVSEMRKVHKDIKKKGKGRYGSKSLMDVVK